MYSYSVIPILENHIEETARDIIRQKEQGIAEMPLLMMMLQPEGAPQVHDKVGYYLTYFEQIAALVRPHGINPGILVQSSLGHDYILDEPAPFQRIVNGETDEQLQSYCPADPALRAYFRGVFLRLAEAKPGAVMIDDDFRLIARPCKGCLCERHLQAFNGQSGLSFTREQLWEYLQTHDTTDKTVQLFNRTQTDSLVTCAAEMRKGLDEIDPSIQGLVCINWLCLENGEVAKVFAGKGNPVIMRAPNGIYAPQGVLQFSDMMRRSAATRYQFRDVADIVISETDAIPYNRYGKSAYYLHAQYTCTLLQGMKGGLHWLTRYDEFSPQSGEAYRRVLAEYAGFYEKIAALADEVQWQGCRLPFPKKEAERAGGCGHFFSNFLERVGIPFYYSEKPGGTVTVNGDLQKWFTDEEIKAFFGDSVILAADAAEAAAKAGCEKDLGVAVKVWQGAPISGEIFDNGNLIYPLKSGRELAVTDKNTEVLSTAFHYHGKAKQPLFPASTLLKRGDKITAVFYGTPQAAHNYAEGFGFLCETRKQQFISILKQAGTLPVYYPEDAQLMLCAGKIANGRLLVLILNTGIDPLPALPLVFENAPLSVTRLNNRGEEESVAFSKQGNTTLLQTPCFMMQPLVLLVK